MKGERSKPARQALKAEVSSLRKELIKRQHKSVVDLLAAAQVRALYPLPCTLHPAPCTLHPTPCTLHPTPCTLHPTRPIRCLNFTYSLNHKP